MQDFLLSVIAILLSVQTGAFGWIVVKVWNHEQEINTIRAEQRLCPTHFKRSTDHLKQFKKTS